MKKIEFNEGDYFKVDGYTYRVLTFEDELEICRVFIDECGESYSHLRSENEFFEYGEALWKKKRFIQKFTKND